MDRLLDLNQLRERLRKMNDQDLARFGKVAQSMCNPSVAESGLAMFAIHLDEASAEWIRRHPISLTS
jgi:hypothetical protein